MVLDFPVLADYAVLPVSDKLMYMTHGHKWGPQNLPPLCKGDILINGHTHVPKCEDNGSFIYMNCGSVSIPKENSPHSFMTLYNGEFLWKNIETNETYNKFII